jgi:hypothetical protein
LFELDPTDYKGWAKGLKKAGYATAPDYADKLIRIIEQEELHRFDFAATAPLLASEDTLSVKTEGPTLNAKGKPVTNAKKKFLIHRMKHHENGTPYVILKQGETIEILSDSLNMRVVVLLAINDATYETVLKVGEAVFIDYKKTRSKKKFVVATNGLTMRAISQQNAIRLDKLYKYNNYPVGRQPKNGEKIRLRPVGLIERMRD